MRATDHTLADLFEQFQAEYLIDKAPNTQYHYRLFFPRVLHDLGPLLVEDVTPECLRAWKTTLRQRHSSGTVRTYMAMLHTTLAYAVEELKWLPQHPLTAIRKPPPAPERVRFLSVEECRCLLAACQHSPCPLLYPIVLVALATGGRKREITGLRWPEVDFEQGMVRFLRTKNKQPRAVPLVGEALAVLTAMAARRDPLLPWVFPCPMKHKPIFIDNYWCKARKRSGVQDFRFHDLRHTFASYLAMSGATLREMADALGHRTLQQTMRYAHLLPSHTASVVERMARQFLSPDEGDRA